MSKEPKLSFKQQQLIVRENAIIDATNSLLAQKGFDLMTMDEVAAEVGIAKASLYKHFPSKEALAAAAMIRLLENTLAFVRSKPAPDTRYCVDLRGCSVAACSAPVDGHAFAFEIKFPAGSQVPASAQARRVTA